MKVMPNGVIASLIAIVVAAIHFAKIHTAGGGALSSIYFGALIGPFLCLHLRDPQLYQPEHRPYADNLPVHCLLHAVGSSSAQPSASSTNQRRFIESSRKGVGGNRLVRGCRALTN